jgi:hypothetical protein
MLATYSMLAENLVCSKATIKFTLSLISKYDISKSPSSRKAEDELNRSLTSRKVQEAKNDTKKKSKLDLEKLEGRARG